jgi:hypothetical protein
MDEFERKSAEAEIRRQERLFIAGEDQKAQHMAELAYRAEIDQLDAERAAKSQEAHQKEMDAIRNEHLARVASSASMMGSLSALMGGRKKANAITKGLLIGEAWANTYVAATRALATPPAPNYFAFGAAMLQGGVAAQGISQKMVVGGLPRGRNAVVQMNEAGQEFVGNAGMTRTVGRDFVERGNSGATREELAELLGGQSRGGVTVNVSGAIGWRMMAEEVIPAIRQYERSMR